MMQTVVCVCWTSTWVSSGIKVGTRSFLFGKKCNLLLQVILLVFLPVNKEI
jgi:hypothetical protein